MAPWLLLAKKDQNLNSMHHAAAEVAALRMKRFVIQRREMRRRGELPPVGEISKQS